MKNTKDPKSADNVKPKDEPEAAPPNNTTETPIPDSASISASGNDHKKVSREDIELVQNLIERCLQLYMNRDEVVKTLLNRARIDPGFTTLVWQKLEEENADFFRAYYIRLKLKKQIILFNHLLEYQYNVMKYPMPPKVPLAPMHNGIHPIPVNNFPMGYPVLQQPPMPVAGQPHFDPMYYSHIANGVPVTPNFHPMRIDSGNEMAIENGTVDATPMMAPNNAMSSMSDIAMSPTSVASSGHFPFSASEISGMGVDTTTVDPEFTHDVASSVGLELQPDNRAGTSRDPLSSQIPWNFSFSDLTADLSNLGDLGALGNYPGSPFLPSDSDILLDSPEQEGIVEEFFVDSDSIPGQQPPSDEEKP